MMIIPKADEEFMMLAENHNIILGMPIEAYLREARETPFEIINGERIYKMPSGWMHSEIIRLIFRLLDSFVTLHHLGDVYPESTFIFPHPDHKNWL
jgi:Uma2 family endonuclease